MEDSQVKDGEIESICTASKSVDWNAHWHDRVVTEGSIFHFLRRVATVIRTACHVHSATVSLLLLQIFQIR